MTKLLCACVATAAIVASGCGSDPAPAREQRDAPVRQSAAQAPVQPPAASPLPRVVFLGDSLSAGYGIDKDDAVPAVIQRKLAEEGFAYEVVNAAVSGDTSDGGLTRLDWSLQGDVKVLVIEIGANDGLRGISPSRTRDNLDKIIETAQRRGIAVLLTGMEALPNYGPEYTSAFRRVFRDIAREKKVAFMPFYLDGVAGVPSLNIADGIHPTPEGARVIANNLWPHLRPLLKKPNS
jgi:acyl-CoA thioesterase I